MEIHPCNTETEDIKRKGEKQNHQADVHCLSNEKARKYNATEKEILEIRVDTDVAMEQLELPYRKVKDMESAYLLDIDTKEQIEEIVAKLQTLTNVTWSVKQTRKFEPCLKKKPKKPITVWKRIYGCHMSTRTRTKTKKLRNKKSRNINCPAKLLISKRAFLASCPTRPTLALFDKQFPYLFEFRNHHNHLVDIPDVSAIRPMGDYLKDDICKLLNKGHSCASAFHTLYVIKAEEFGANYKSKITDRHNFARRNDILSIYKTHGFKERYHRYLDLPYTVKNLEEMLRSYQEKNGTLFKISAKNGSISICLSTPIMQRNILHMSDVIYIEQSGEEFKEYRIYFILTETSIGALPISCILTNKHDMAAFSEGMKMFFEIIQIRPTVVLSNAVITEELVAQKFFPNSKIFFSFYHTLREAWKVLYETRHELPRIKKECYYQLFREIVFASSEEGLKVARQVLAVECTHPMFLSFIDKMFENTPLWCMYYRQYMRINGSDTFNYNKAEESFRIFRLISKIALERTKMFNINQITDFICSAFEIYYRNRILEMVLSKASPVLEEKYGRIGEIAPPQMEDIGHHLYLFTKSVPEISDEYYQVDMLTDLCTCGFGSIGKHCDHVAEILLKCKVFYPELAPDEKAKFYSIATGKPIHQNAFSNSQNLSLLEERTFCFSPAGIVGSAELDLPQDDINDKNANKNKQDLEITKNQWISYSNKITKLMEKNPDKFVPAVRTHLNNIENYSASIPDLLKGLYGGFPPIKRTDEPPPLTIIHCKKNTSASSGKVKKIYQKPETNFKKNALIKKKEEIEAKQRGSPLTSLEHSAKNNPTKILKHRVLADTNELTWESFNGKLTPASLTAEFRNNSNVQYDLPVLEGQVDFLDEQIQVGPDLSKSSQHMDLTSNEDLIDESMILDQFSNPDFELNSEPIGSAIVNDSSGLINIQNTVFVDQNTLRHLRRNEVAIIDENKGILILPLETD